MAKKTVKTKKNLKSASWVPETPEAAALELRTILAAKPDAMNALERAWQLAIKIAPTSIALAYYPAEPPMNVSPIDIDDKQLAHDLLGADPVVDEAALIEVGHVIANTGLLLVGKRPDSDRRTAAEITTYLTSLLVPYLYVCCEVALGVVPIKSRWWALSEFAFNPGIPAPSSPELWERIILSWRKHYMVGGVEGRKNKQGVVVPHTNNITVDGIRRRLDSELRRRRQGS